MLQLPLAKFPVGHTQGDLEITYTDGGNGVAEGGYRVLNQPYSIVFGYRFDSDTGGKFANAVDDTLDWVQVRTYGYANTTALSTLATTVGASATYTGNAFYGTYAATGVLSYTVDFANSTGFGTITDLPTGLGLATITLK